MAISNPTSPVCVSPPPKSPKERNVISVLIAADSRIDCQLLSHSLERSRSQFRIVACALTKPDAVRLTEVHSPDIALINESLQDGTKAGIEVSREVRLCPSTKVILLMRSAREDCVVAAFRAGVSGIFGRNESVEALCKCITAVHGGQIWANSSQLRCLLAAFTDSAPRALPNPVGQAILTRREMEVARLVIEGHTNRSAAEKLGLSEHTISNYLFRMYEKLGVSNRVELVLYLLDASQAIAGKNLSFAEPRKSVRKRLAVAE